MIDPLGPLQISARLLAMGALIRSVELLGVWREFRRDGLLARRVPWSSHWVSRRVDTAMAPAPLAVVVLVLQAVAATAMLILPVTHPLGRTSAIVLLATAVFNGRRFKTVSNASDVMSTIALGGVAAAALDEGDGTLRSVGLVFVALQAAIAYLAAGFVKLFSPLWRSGVAIERVAWCRFARKSLTATLTCHTVAPRLVAWAATGLELLLGISFLLPTPLMLAVLASGVAFHLLVAFGLRLYFFLWAFIASYPALYFLHVMIYG